MNIKDSVSCDSILQPSVDDQIRKIEFSYVPKTKLLPLALGILLRKLTKSFS